MGTRAQFFIGDPMDITSREWLGTIAWDGYPDGECEGLVGCKNQRAFKNFIRYTLAKRDDFCDPKKRGFPFPWVNNLFLTDWTYTWWDGRVQISSFNRGWIDLDRYMSDGRVRRGYHRRRKTTLSKNVPAPGNGVWDRGAPDSIMIVSMKAAE